MNPPLGPSRRVGRKTKPPAITISNDPTLATDIGPYTFEDTVFDNDHAPNAGIFFWLEFDLVGQPLLTGEQPLVDA